MVRVTGLVSLFGPPSVGSERAPSQLECSHSGREPSHVVCVDGVMFLAAGLSSGILSLDVTSGLAP